MISFLKGKLIIKDYNFIIIDVNSVGYKVFLNSSFLSELIIGNEYSFFTHQYIREDALDLYGFRNLEELEIFEQLISVSGIGPKTALGVLAAGSLAEIKESISHGDSHLLTKVSGIGHKTAERVILELREKIGLVKGTDAVTGAREATSTSDEIDALVALGYSSNDARTALQKVSKDIKSSSDRVKEALKNIGKK